jgi:hypothetical protein
MNAAISELMDRAGGTPSFTRAFSPLGNPADHPRGVAPGYRKRGLSARWETGVRIASGLSYAAVATSVRPSIRG